jgi:hypothetical protein
MNWYKKSKSKIVFPPHLTSSQMKDFILNNNLRDWSGEIDYKNAQEIANSVKQWNLTELP